MDDAPRGVCGVAPGLGASTGDSVFSCLESLAGGGLVGGSGGGGGGGSGAGARWVQLPADMCVTPLYTLLTIS